MVLQYVCRFFVFGTPICLPQNQERKQYKCVLAFSAVGGGTSNNNVEEVGYFHLFKRQKKNLQILGFMAGFACYILHPFMLFNFPCELGFGVWSTRLPPLEEGPLVT